MENYKAGGEKGNSNLFATNRLFKKSPLFRKRKKKAPGVYDPKAKYRFDKGGEKNKCKDGEYWDGEKCTRLITYGTDQKLIDGVANWAMHSADPDKISLEYNDQIKHYLYTGKYGYDPINMSLIPLKTIDKKLISEPDEETKAIRKKEKITEKKYFEEIEKDEAYNKALVDEPKYADEGLDFVKGWHDSPMYNQMVLNSFHGNQLGADYLTKLRKENIADIPPINIMATSGTTPYGFNPAATSNSRTGEVKVYPEGFGMGPAMYTHEYFHTSDKPRGIYNWDFINSEDPRFPNDKEESNERVMPESDQMYITRNRGSNWKDNEDYKSRVEKWPEAYNMPTDEKIKKILYSQDVTEDDEDFQKSFNNLKNIIQTNHKISTDTNQKEWKTFAHDYVSQPTEVRARLGEIRYQARKDGIYDPFIEQITPEIFQNYLNKKRSYKNWNESMSPIKDLRKQFTDEEILWMLQNISKNDEGEEEIKVAAKGGASEQKIIFSPMEGGCPEGQYWTGTECKIIPKNTKIVYSEAELAKSNITKKEQQKLYNQYITRVNNHNTYEAARLKKYGTISAKDKFYKTFESIPRTGWDPWMSYGTGKLMPPQDGIPFINEPMVSFGEWKKMMAKSSVKPIGFKGHPGGGHFYPVYAKPSNYLLGYNKEEEPVIPIDPIKEEVVEPAKIIDPVKEEVIVPTVEPVINKQESPLIESMGTQDYPEELKGSNWEWDKKWHSFTTPRLNKHFPLGPLFNGKKKHNFSTPYLHRRKDYEDGGIIADLSPEEIEEYRKGGYVIEDISVPSLSHMDEGGALNEFAGGGQSCPNNYVWNEMFQMCMHMQCKSGYEWSDDFQACVKINYYPEITVTAKGRKKLFSPYKTSLETTDDKIKQTKKKGMVYRSTADELKKLEAVKQKEIEEEIKRKELARLQALEDAFNATNKSDNTNVALPTAEPLKFNNDLLDSEGREKALNKETERILNSGQGMFGVKDLWDDKHNALSLRELIKQQLSADPQAFYKKMENASYQDFVNREQKQFDNLNWLEVGLNELGNFAADPIHTGATWLGGSRTGVQQGKHVRDVTDPDYNNWQRMTGYNDNWLNSTFNVINPLASSADAAVSFSQGDVLGFGANTVGAVLKGKILTQGLNATSKELSGVLNKEILGSKYLTGTNALRAGSAYKGATEYIPNIYGDVKRIASGEGTWEDFGSGIYNLTKLGSAALPFTKFNNAALYPKIANAKNTFGFVDSGVDAAGGNIVDYSKALDKVNKVGDAAKPLAFSAALRFSKIKKEGGAIETNISKSEIKKLIAQGYVIEEIHNNELSKEADGGTVSQLWQQYTGTPWSEAKKQGLTDGSFESNISLRKKILEGEFGEAKIPNRKETPNHEAYKNMVSRMISKGATLEDLVAKRIGTKEGLVNMFSELRTPVKEDLRKYAAQSKPKGIPLPKVFPKQIENAKPIVIPKLKPELPVAPTNDVASWIKNQQRPGPNIFKQSIAPVVPQAKTKPKNPIVPPKVDVASFIKNLQRPAIGQKAVKVETPKDILSKFGITTFEEPKIVSPSNIKKYIDQAFTQGKTKAKENINENFEKDLFNRLTTIAQQKALLKPEPINKVEPIPNSMAAQFSKQDFNKKSYDANGKEIKPITPKMSDFQTEYPFKETIEDTGKFIKDTKESIGEYIEYVSQGIIRKSKTYGFIDDDDIKVPELKESDNPLGINEYYKNLNSTQQSFTIPNSNRNYKQQVLPISNIKLGYRNRGDYNDIESEGLELTTFHPFTNSDKLKNITDNTSVFALDADGNLHTGQFKDFKNNKDWKFSQTYMNKIIDIEDLYVDGSKSGNPGYKQPKVKVLENGKIKDGSLNILTKGKDKDDYYGSIQGGRILFVNPVTKEQYLVSGSLSTIKKEFKKLKGTNQYLEAWTLDNGTYSRGLSYDDKKLTADRLKAYDNENSSGGNGLYIMNYKTPVNEYEEEYVLDMPNLRTKNDASYKKGHKLKNEVKNIVLHHTAYEDTKNNESQVRNQYMTPGKSSSHVVIEEDGKRTVYASPEQVTFHAGESEWNGRKDVNDFSIGVEFQGNTVNTPLTDAQIKSFIEYYRPIATKYNLSLKDVISHQMISPDRKPDVTAKEYQRILKYMKEKGFK
jgi:hypothetical protein